MTTMRTRALLIGIAALAALAGCGDHRLILRVDLLSYLAPAERTVPVATLPGLDTTVALVNDQPVSLFEGLSEAARVESVNLALGALAVDSLGSGTVTLRLYLADEGTDPLGTPPVIEQTLTLAPGRTDTLSASVDGDARVAELFGKHALRATITAGLHPTDPLSPLAGRVTFTRLDAVVICRRSL